MTADNMNVDDSKVEAAYEKLLTNPDLFTPVQDALAAMFHYINPQLNRAEQLIMLQRLFSNKPVLPAAPTARVHPYWVPPPVC